jgi:hypothetical protein
MHTSSKSGTPVEASEEVPEDVVATVDPVAGVGLVAARATGTPVGDEGDGPEPGPVLVGDVDTVGPGHDASALPPSAPSMPQTVTGSVTPVPGPPGVPIGIVVDSAPVHVPLELPSRAAVTAQIVTGALTGTDPVGVVAWCEGSQVLLAEPATATTTLHALTGMTPSTGALWLTSLVGRSLTRGNPASGMHIPLAEPSTSTIAPQAVTGMKTSASWPCWFTSSGRCGQFAELLPSISAITSQTVTGTSASTTPVCVTGPFVPVVLQSLEVFPTSPTLTEQMLTGTLALMAPFCVVDAEDCPLVSPSAEAAWPSSPIALSCAVIGTWTFPIGPVWFSPTEVVEQLLLASANRPTESEQAFTGALTLAKGDDCPVVLVPVVESCPGRSVLPISFASAVIGTEMGTGEEVNGASGSEAGGTAGVLGAAGAAGATVPVACATAAAAAFCTSCTVVCTPLGDGAAPAGVTPATAPAASISPHARPARAVSRFRLKILLLLCWDNTPALSPLPRSYRRNGQLAASMRNRPTIVIAATLWTRQVLRRGARTL